MDHCSRVPTSSELSTCSSRVPPRSAGGCSTQDLHQHFPYCDSTFPPSNSSADTESNDALVTTNMPFENAEASSSFPIQRPASPAPTADFSIIDVDVNTFPSVHYRQTYPYGEPPHGHATTHYDIRSYANEYGHPRAASHISSFQTRRGFHSSPSLALCGSAFASLTDDTLQDSYPFDLANSVEAQYSSDDAGRESPSNPLRTILPRIWEALSSPGKSLFPIVTSPSSCPISSVAAPCCPSTRQSSTNSGSFPRWKGKGKAKSISPDWESEDTDGHLIDYSELAPLDGEEGELIDDEACFIDIRAVTGVGEFHFISDYGHPMRQPHCDRT